MFDAIFDKLEGTCLDFIKKSESVLLDDILYRKRYWFRRCSCCNQRLIAVTAIAILAGMAKSGHVTYSACPSPKCPGHKGKREFTRTIFFTPLHSRA